MHSKSEIHTLLMNCFYVIKYSISDLLDFLFHFTSHFDWLIFIQKMNNYICLATLFALPVHNSARFCNYISIINLYQLFVIDILLQGFILYVLCSIYYRIYFIIDLVIVLHFYICICFIGVLCLSMLKHIIQLLFVIYVSFL